jgi:hypothetical protein
MNLRFLVVTALLTSLAGRAEAGVFGGKDTLPKPVSLVSERVERNVFVGLQARHPPKQYSGPKWGARWDLSLKDVERPLRPSLLNR